MPVADLAIPRCLETTVCSNCGYSLLGLPSPIVCPECGRNHEPGEVVLHGYARGRHEHVGNARSSRLAWVIVCSLFYVAIQFPQFMFNQRWFCLIAAMTLVPMVYLLARRRDGGHPGLIQLRLNRFSCVQYDDLGGPAPLRDFGYSNGWIAPAVAIIAVVFSWRLKWMGSIQLGFWLGGLIFALVLTLATSRRYRLALRQVNEGAVADLNAAICEPMPWEKIKDFELTQIKPGIHRLQVNGYTKMYGNDVINAELTLTDQQAEALENLLTVWSRNARLTPYRPPIE